MDTWLGDLRSGLRAVGRSAGSSAVAVLTLALGLGAVVLVLSVVRAVLLTPLPHPESGRLVLVWERAPIAGYEELPLSAPDYLDLRAWTAAPGGALFDALAVFEFVDAAWTGGETPRALRAVAVSPDLFPLLGAEAELGRTFARHAERPGADPVAVLGYGFWQRDFGGERGVVGRSLVLNGRPHTVVGVMPETFRFPFPVTWRGRTWRRASTDVFVPAIVDPAAPRGEHRWMTLGRLAPEISRRSAERRLGAVMEKLAAAHPDVHPPGLGARLVRAEKQAVSEARPALLLLLAAVVLLLLIAASNVAHLLLARATSRAKEMALRGAFGATRRRLVTQLLAESLVLGLASAGLGLFAAAWAIEVVTRLEIGELPGLAAARLDAPIMGLAVALAVGTSLAFGFLPALAGARADLTTPLKELGRGLSAGPGRGRLLRGVVVSELALAAALLVATAWMAESWRRLEALDPGFEIDGAVTLELALNGCEPGDCRLDAARRIVEAVRELPGVDAAGATSAVPLSGREDGVSFIAEGGAPAPAGELRLATRRRISPGYLAALGVALVDGRPLRRSDDAAAPRVVLVNHALAERVWPGLEAVGRRLALGGPDPDPGRRGSRETAWWTIAGVVGDLRERYLDRDADPAIYVPLAQDPSPSLTLLVRSPLALESLAPRLEGALWSVDRSLPVAPRQLRDTVDAAVERYRLQTLLIALLAAAALVLAGSGIFGVMSFLVEERRHELAIRVALGARHNQVAGLVVRQGLGLAGLGVAIGLAAMLIAGPLLRGVFFGLSVADPRIFAGVPAVLLAVAAVAAFYPAYRASLLDAIEALRAE